MDECNAFRILITGSRSWQDVETIQQALDPYADVPFGNVVLVSGECPRGADYLCEIYAATLGWQIERHPANWKLYKKQAGYIRNSEMVVLGADVCLAFIKDESNGATHCATLAQEAGIPTYIFNERKPDEVRGSNVRGLPRAA